MMRYRDADDFSAGRTRIIAVIVVALLGCGIAAAQTQNNVDLVDDVQPPHFSPASGSSSYCYTGPPVSIPHGVTGIDIPIDVPCANDPTIIKDLDVLIQIHHTWVGDLIVTLSKMGGPEAVVIDQVGQPPTQCCGGCPGNDIDAILNDAATDPVEDECEPGVPTIQGEFIPGDPPSPQLLTQFEGLELCGTWKVHVADPDATARTGSLLGWCLLPDPPDVIPDPPDDVPSTTGVGVIVMILLLLGTSGYALWRGATD